MSVKKNAAYTSLTQILGLILGFISSIFLTRLVGPGGRGDITLLNTNIEFFILISSFCVSEGLVYFGASEKIDKSKLAGLALIVIIVGLILTGLILGLLQKSGEGSFILLGKLPSTFLYFYIYISFVLGLIGSCVKAFLSSARKFFLLNKISLFNSFLTLVVFFGLWIYVVITGNNISINYILIFILTVLFSVSVLLGVLYVQVINIKPDFDLIYDQDIQPFFVFLFIGYLSNILNFFNYRLDVWIVTYYQGAEGLGLYSLAVNLGQMFWLLPVPVAQVLLPHLSGQEQPNRIETYTFMSRVNFCLLLCATVGAFFIAEVVITRLYGKEFNGSVRAFQLLLPGIFFGGLTKLLAVYAQSVNKVKYNLWATIAGIFLTITLDFLLIPTHGINGAAVASSISYFAIFSTVTCCLFASRYLPFQNYYLLTLSDLSLIRGKVSTLLWR